MRPSKKSTVRRIAIASTCGPGLISWPFRAWRKPPGYAGSSRRTGSQVVSWSRPSSWSAPRIWQLAVLRTAAQGSTAFRTTERTTTPGEHSVVACDSNCFVLSKPSQPSAMWRRLRPGRHPYGAQPTAIRRRTCRGEVDDDPGPQSADEKFRGFQDDVTADLVHLRLPSPA